MANQRQDFLRKINKGWSPVHMNLNRPKMAFHKPKKQEDTGVIGTDNKQTAEKSPKSE